MVFYLYSPSLPEYDIITVGEAPFTYDPSGLADFVLPANKELNMVFSFEIVEIDQADEGPDHEPGSSTLVWSPWKLPKMKTIVNRWQTLQRDQGFWNS